MFYKANSEDPNFFWENFRLGTELQIAGAFIYNGIYLLDNMQTFYHEEESFEFIYNISVGLERLMKVAVILIEHESGQPQEAFEKSLINHNHLWLLNRIKKVRKLILGKEHKKFLLLLEKFYNSARYDRYNLSSVYHAPYDKKELISFISEHLKIAIKTDLPFSTGITINIRKFIGKLISKLTIQIFEIIKQKSARLQTYTCEISYNSKAFKIFIAKEFDFEKERLMQRETLLFLLNNFPEGQLKKFIDGLEPLEFGQLNANQYIESIFNIHKDRDVMDEMEYLYEEHKLKRSRVDEIMLIGSDLNLDDSEDIDEDDSL